MKIKKRDIFNWIDNKTPVRYHGKIYHTWYNGRNFFLKEILGDSVVNFYRKDRLHYGLETNK